MKASVLPSGITYLKQNFFSKYQKMILEIVTKLENQFSSISGIPRIQKLNA